MEVRDGTKGSTPGWPLILTFYLLLLGVSAVAFLAPPMATREGRWGLGLALLLVGASGLALGSRAIWGG